MKKILPLLIIVTSLFFVVSCKKSDEKLIVGTWEATNLQVKSYLNGTLSGDVSQTLTPDFQAFEFRKDKTFTNYVYGKDNYSGNYSIEGDQLTIDNQAGTFSISKNAMSMETISEKKMGSYVQRNEFYWTLERK